MAKKKKQPKPARRGRITEKRVQAAELLPAAIVPDVTLPMEVDDGELNDLGLTPKQVLFVAFYCGSKSFNATLAAKEAGYQSENYNSLKQMAHSVLHLPRVQAAIARKLAMMELDPENLKNGIASQAQASMANFLSPGPDGQMMVDLKRAASLGALGQLKEIKEEVIEVNGTATVLKRTIKIHDPLPARIALAKIQGLLKENVNHSGTVQFHPITLDGDKTAADDNDA